MFWVSHPLPPKLNEKPDLLVRKHAKTEGWYLLVLGGSYVNPFRTAVPFLGQTTQIPK